MSERKDPKSCEHKRLRVETRRLTMCLECGSRMVKFRGDWAPASTEGVLAVGAGDAAEGGA